MTTTAKEDEWLRVVTKFRNEHQSQIHTVQTSSLPFLKCLVKNLQ